jgi:hypothetical protein
MTGLELAIGVVGVVITIMVVVGMVLIVPRGVEAAPIHTADPALPGPVSPDADRARDRAARQTVESR